MNDKTQGVPYNIMLNCLDGSVLQSMKIFSIRV